MAVVGALTLSTLVSAEERQHYLRGTAVLDLLTGNVVGAGHATHLGNYTEVGFASVSDTGHLEGCVILTAANGDELWEHVSGQLNPFTGEITATVAYIGGTGRFEDATGSASLVAQLQLDGPIATIAVVVDGTIDYGAASGVSEQSNEQNRPVRPRLRSSFLTGRMDAILAGDVRCR